jgi:DNA polymerase III delta prime subunit
MANNKIVINEKIERKYAPIFVNQNKHKNNVSDNKTYNNLKRKKKLKNKINNQVIKKSDNSIEDNSMTIDCRRSQRLRNKVLKVEEVVSNEVIVEENNENYLTKNNEIIDDLNEENSNTIDYWIDFKQFNQNEDINEIEVIYSQIPNSSSQQSLKTPLVSIPSIDGQKECLLWTEKYKPSNSSEIIGHKRAVKTLKTWLEDWNKSDNRVDTIDDEFYDCLSESNTCLLICGPTGSGKTSMVYAIAEELKYKVLELNASMKRNARIISRIVGEATQSHHMQRTNDLMSSQSMFNQKNVFTINDSEVKVEKVVKPLKKPKSNGILNYFTKQNDTKSKKSAANNNEIQIIDSKKEDQVFTRSETVLKVSEKLSIDSLISSQKALSITSNSLILFDDIDIMIDEDINGFWNAVNKINDITKKPVILTATQFIPYIKDCVNRLQVLKLNIPDHKETVYALKKVFDKEIESEDQQISENVCQHLSNTFNHDIRRCINELQFNGNEWTKFETKTNQIFEDNSNSISYYDSIIFSDIMRTKFNILSDTENRDLWMNCRPTLIENDNQSIGLAKDIISAMNELSYKVNVGSNLSIDLKESLPLETEFIDSISQGLMKNTSLKSIISDYCPYLSYMCEAESIRQSETANHSRRSRRFMHHLDSIGFYVDNYVKNKLISSFISQTETYVSDNDSENINKTIDLSDDDFYD